MKQTIRQGLAVACVLLPLHSMAQTPANMAALKGLAPVTALPSTAQGRAALAANLAATGGIQTGAVRQPTLLPFAEQQQLALRDAFITDGNYTQLADGLGTTLAAAYQARAHYLDRDRYTNVSDVVADVIAYSNATSGIVSNAGRYFFANMTTNGKDPVSAEAADLLKSIGGIGDVFGASYGRPAGSPGADAFGNSRPFQTEPIIGPDHFHVPADNYVYNRGPVMNLIESPSHPSGHTTYGYMGSLVLAVLVPSRYQEMVVRGAEYGNDRILLGAHYTMDVVQVAPEAGYLLTAAFPHLSLEQANRILTETDGPGGGFLDDDSAFGLYSRLNLCAAAGRAAALAPK